MIFAIAYIQLVRKVRRFSDGFNFSYRVFLLFLIAAVPAMLLAAVAFGVLHRVLNPQLNATDLGLWVIVAATGVVTIFLGSRRKQLDSSLASVLPNASWRFFGQRGCTVLTYMLGRFFLLEISKHILIIVCALGVYIGFSSSTPATAEPKVIAALVLFPLLVVFNKTCYDLLVLLRRYRGSFLQYKGLALPAGSLFTVSSALLLFFVARSLYLGASAGGDMWDIVARQLSRDLSTVLVSATVLVTALVSVTIAMIRRLRTLRWVDLTGQQLEKTHVFKRLPRLSPSWFKAIATTDLRRTRRSFYERMLPVNRVMTIPFVVYIAAAWWMHNGAFDVLPREGLEVLIPYGAGIVHISMVCGAMHSLFSMDADRYAYMLWRTTDQGFQRVIAVRAIMMSLVLYGSWAILVAIFCAIAGIINFVVGMVISIAAATVFGTARMFIVSARWPHLEWLETTDIEKTNLRNLSSEGAAVLLLYVIVFVFQNVKFQSLVLGLVLFITVPLVSAGLSLLGYRVLRKRIRVC